MFQFPQNLVRKDGNDVMALRLSFQLLSFLVFSLRAREHTVNDYCYSDLCLRPLTPRRDPHLKLVNVV